MHEEQSWNNMKEADGSKLVAQIQVLKGILNVAQIVVFSLDLDEVLQNILHSAMSVMDMPAGSVALYDAKNLTALVACTCRAQRQVCCS